MNLQPVASCVEHKLRSLQLQTNIKEGTLLRIAVRATQTNQRNSLRPSVFAKYNQAPTRHSRAISKKLKTTFGLKGFPGGEYSRLFASPVISFPL